MSDILTVWDATRGDYVLVGPVLASGPDIVSAVIISLFTDRRAEPGDVIPDGTTNRRGWWADSGDARIGSRLWLLDRSKKTQPVLTQARDYVAEALQWLIDDGVVERFDTAIEWADPNQLRIQVTVVRRDGSNQAMNFKWAWQGVN